MNAPVREHAYSPLLFQLLLDCMRLIWFSYPHQRYHLFITVMEDGYFVLAMSENSFSKLFIFLKEIQLPNGKAQEIP